MAFLSRGGFLITLLFILGTNTLFAAPADDFRKGQSAFRQGHYEQALKWFEKARRAGMHNAAVHYNLGATYYRLGRYREAEKAFLRTARYPKLAPLAWYNLGLIKRRQGDRKAAADWFRKARQGTRDPKLRALAGQQLRTVTRSRWRSFAYAGIGYDDNITLTSDVLNFQTGKSDGFFELFASTRGILSGSLRNGILLRAGAFGDFYASHSNYNFTDFDAGLYKSLLLGRWNTENGVRLSRSGYGGTGYLQIAGLELRGVRRMGGSNRIDLRLRFRSLSAIDKQYDYFSGNSYDLRIGGRWHTGSDSVIRAYYQYQDNDRNDIATATSFRSVSPRRHRLRLTWRSRLIRNWKMRLAGEYRRSDYKDENRYNSGAIRILRQDNRWRALVGVSRRLSSQTELVFSYTYTTNQSNITIPGVADYDYTRNVVLASVQTAF